MKDKPKSQKESVTPGLRIKKELWYKVKAKYPNTFNKMFREWVESLLGN